MRWWIGNYSQRRSLRSGNMRDTHRRARMSCGGFMAQVDFDATYPLATSQTKLRSPPLPIYAICGAGWSTSARRARPIARGLYERTAPLDITSAGGGSMQRGLLGFCPRPATDSSGNMKRAASRQIAMDITGHRTRSVLTATTSSTSGRSRCRRTPRSTRSRASASGRAAAKGK